jgi:hypothetical protein
MAAFGPNRKAKQQGENKGEGLTHVALLIVIFRGQGVGRILVLVI